MPSLVYSESGQRRRWREADDGELLAAIDGGDELALEALMRRKSAALLQLGYRILGDREEAKDVVQQTFLRVWERSGEFDPRWSPNTWIYRIATNLAIDALRSRKRRQRAARIFRTHALQLAGNGASRDLARLQGREVSQILDQLSSRLSERQRLVFVLRQIHGLNTATVAAVLGCKASTVRNHLFAARQVLRRELARMFPEYGDLADASKREEGEA
jgi:RNA polymerase sigma-70 factor (ECF subfamily)